MIFKILSLLIIVVSAMAFASPPEKIYIDSNDLDESEGSFHIHIGENIWIETNIVHRDITGLNAIESDILTDNRSEMEKVWKCPYCHRYWPLGSACKNKDCPSKYK